MHILAGRGRLVGDDGSSFELAPGAVIVVGDGWSGTWEIEATVRKEYVIWRTD